MKQTFSIEAKSDRLKKIIFDRHLDLLRLFVHSFDLWRT